MAAQSAEYFFVGQHETALAKETGDKKEKVESEENKHEKEYPCYLTSHISIVSFGKSFHHFQAEAPLAPTLSTLTPPPDGLL